MLAYCICPDDGDYTNVSNTALATRILSIVPFVHNSLASYNTSIVYALSGYNTSHNTSVVNALSGYSISLHKFTHSRIIQVL